MTTIAAQLAAIRAKAEAALNPAPEQTQTDAGSRSAETRQRQAQIQRLQAKAGKFVRGKGIRFEKGR